MLPGVGSVEVGPTWLSLRKGGKQRDTKSEQGRTGWWRGLRPSPRERGLTPHCQVQDGQVGSASPERARRWVEGDRLARRYARMAGEHISASCQSPCMEVTASGRMTNLLRTWRASYWSNFCFTEKTESVRLIQCFPVWYSGHLGQDSPRHSAATAPIMVS